MDPHPSPTHHCYAATATDEAGNQSGPSEDVYLNFGLLPVANLTVVQEDNASPAISWTHPGAADIEGYDLYCGFGATNTKLNTDFLRTLSRHILPPNHPTDMHSKSGGTELAPKKLSLSSHLKAHGIGGIDI